MKVRVYELLLKKDGEDVEITLHNRRIDLSFPLGDDADLFCDSNRALTLELERAVNFLKEGGQSYSIWFLRDPINRLKPLFANLRLLGAEG